MTIGCVDKTTKVYVNNSYKIISELWHSYRTKITFDDVGEWTIPRDQLFVKCLDENKNIVDDKIIRMYREKINSHIRKIKFNNGLEIRANYSQKLLTFEGWRDNIGIRTTLRIIKNDMTSKELSSVISIDRIEYNEYVYCFETESHKNYIAEGIVCYGM